MNDINCLLILDRGFEMVVELTCEVPSCGVKKSAETHALALQSLTLHHQQAHLFGQTNMQKAPKIDRPRIKQGVDEDEWQM